LDDLFVDPRRLLHLHVRRRTLRQMSRTLAVSGRVCRQRQLLRPWSALGWGALAVLLATVGAGLAGSASYLPRYRSGVTTGRGGRHESELHQRIGTSDTTKPRDASCLG
jgi:hypothetical protein